MERRGWASIRSALEGVEFRSRSQWVTRRKFCDDVRFRYNSERYSTGGSCLGILAQPRSAIRDSRPWLPVFRYAPYGLRADVWNERHDDGRDNRINATHALALRRHPRDRLHRYLRARHGGDAPLLRGGPRLSAAA